MKREMKIKLEAYLDGELSPREKRRVEAWLQGNAEGQTLLAELRMTKSFLVGNEPERTVPESREFYWSKIERQIEHLEQQPRPWIGWHWLFAWRKYVVSAAGVALVVLLALLIPRADELSRTAEVENLSDDIGSLSFRAPSENMFVVWVYEKNKSSESESPYPEEDDIFVQ